MMTLFDDEQILRAYAKDIEEKTARETAERLIKDGEINNSYTGEDLHDMIEDINRYHLESEEILSDYAYHYNVMLGKIQLLGKDCSFCNL